MNAVEQRMAELSARFAAQASEQREILRQCRARGDVAGLRDHAHRLAGIAGMFGQVGIGAAALALETVIEADADHAAQADRLDELLAALAATGQT